MLYKSNLLTLELLYIVDVLVSIDTGAQVAIILLAFGPCVVIVDYWDRFCTLGRAPRTKETLPNFRKWCRVTQHPRVFRGLTDCQRTPGFGASHYSYVYFQMLYFLQPNKFCNDSNFIPMFNAKASKI